MIEVVIENNNNLSVDLLNNLTEELLNSAKSNLESELKNAECEIHKKNSSGTITLTVVNQDVISNYSNFCCEKFKNKFK